MKVLAIIMCGGLIEMSLSLILIIQVTTDKVLVLSMIDDSRLIKRQVVVFTYFKKFVNSLDGNKLLSFLHYITGSSSIAVHAIKLRGSPAKSGPFKFASDKCFLLYFLQ